MSFSILITGTGICNNNIPVNPDKVCISKEEKKLYQLINDYRKAHGLNEIPFSLNLTIVARSHAIDLFKNKPHKEDSLCNMHSWSNKGNWKACCYTSDHNNVECMWDKPKEITNYPFNGYEMVFFYSPVTNQISMAKEALESWKTSPTHNMMIINSNMFRNTEWKSIGVSIYKEYAIVWFGELADKAGAPNKCKNFD